MFDRHSPHTAEKRPMPVSLRLADGTVHRGTVSVRAGASLGAVVNANNPFLSIRTFDGEVIHVGRGHILSIQALQAPAADQLDRQEQDADRFDPHRILGLDRGADADRLRDAYTRAVKAYHPDRISGLDLPPEMVAYAGAMLKRINAAYDALKPVKTAA